MGSYEHVRGSSPARSEFRKMSLNPVGAQLPPAAKEEPIGALEVSKRKRIREPTLPLINTESSHDADVLDNSPGRRRCLLLPAVCRCRLWVCCDQAGLGHRGGIQGILPSGGDKFKIQNML